VADVERITISVDEKLAEEFDALIKQRGYQNRSEAFRDVLRKYIETSRVAEAKATHCVASVSYVYSHHERQLATRLTDYQHAHHDLTVASMHAHLDHEYGIETLLLRGRIDAVQSCADTILAERGVRHGAINLIPVDGTANKHTHAKFGTHMHTHYRPKS
jgi:CopG family transcriptional regulator, nickel-responsive regulator